MRQLSRSLIILILFMSAASLITPAHAQVTMTLSWTAINAPASGYVTEVVTLATSPLDPAAHTVTLSVAGAGGYYGWGGFSPNPVVVPPLGGTVSSTFTIPIPGPENYCPGESSPGPFALQLTVQGSEGGAVVASASLVVYLMPMTYPLNVHVEPSKPSYMIGETITIKMDSNLPAEYYLNIRKPDGTVWSSVHGYLPATYTKKAADPLGTYSVELQAYYCGVAQSSASFTVTPDTYDVTISLAGLPPDVTTALQVDGSKVADMKGGDVKVLTYPIGTSHSFGVDQYVNGAAGYRYYCESNSWTANTGGSDVFNYATQVYLDVSTDPAGITDVTTPGWYSKGASATISSVPAEVEGTKGTKYVFTTWAVDGTPRSENGFVLVMDVPHNIVAQYNTMFLLTIVSDFGNPKGAGYYKSGDTAAFSVDSPAGFGIQHIFVEWKGDYTGKNPKGSVSMDGPKTVTATWSTSYFQLYIIVGVIAAAAAVGGLFFWRRGMGAPSALKPAPPPPPPTSPTETPKSSVGSLEPAKGKEDKPRQLKQPVSVALRCTNCGHELKKGQEYCPECGQKQTD